ncbi:MAG: energy transducer TonB [Bacteroidaceae bacterium]|nr:energy transducer TonB [Bacteroidaceae bacterium]
MKKTIIIAFLSFLAGIAFCFLYDNNSTEAEPVNEVQEINEDTIVVDAKTHCLQQMEKALAGDTIIKSITGKVKRRNSLILLVNMDMKILITRGEEPSYEIDSTDIKYLIKEFLRNSDNDIRFPEYVEMDLPRLGRRSVITRDYFITVNYSPLREKAQKGIGLEYDSEPIDTLINDAPFYVEPIFMAINELRNEFAWKEFHKSFEDCDSVEKEVCTTAYPCKIHDGFYYDDKKIVPPPPEAKKIVDIIEIVEDEVEIEESKLVSIEGEVVKFSDSIIAAEDHVFQVVEEQPEFPGGMKALMKYLQENRNYPKLSRDNNSQGRVFVRFIVNADGSIGNAEILKSSGDIYLDKEALRVVGCMPQWSPGKQAGKPVRVYFTIPVVFRLP